MKTLEDNNRGNRKSRFEGQTIQTEKGQKVKQQSTKHYRYIEN